MLELLTKAVCIEDGLDQTFALDYHKPSVFSGNERTEIGELVYRAKYQGDKEKATQLAVQMSNFIKTHPSYKRADFIVAVPPSKPRPSLDLPSYLAQQLASEFKIQNGKAYVTKVRTTTPMKDILSLTAKIDNMRGAFQVTNPEILTGKLVILIDDIYQSGITLHEMASELQRCGATVLGLVATKTISDPR